MRPAIIAYTAALLLIGATSVQAQDATGTPGNSGAIAAQSAPAPGQATIQPGISPKLRKKLLQDLLNAIAPPRPVAAVPAPVGPIVTTPPAATPGGTPGAVTVTPVPPPPRPATGVALTPAVTVPAPRPATTTVPRPRPIVQPARPTPARSDPRAAPAAPIEPSPLPPPVAAPVKPAPAIAPPIAASPTPVVVEPVQPIPAPTRANLSARTVLLLGLLAAAAVAAAVMHWQRTRRIERTRAAFALKPRIDLSAGACSIHGLSLASPPLAIRARLVQPGMPGG